MDLKTPAGSDILDTLLDGGYENDVLTCIYGPPGSGKTLMTMLCAIGIAEGGKRIVYIDTEGNFSVARFQQLVGERTEELLEKFIFMRPIDFDEQAKAFGKLRQIVDARKIGLIVLDSAAMLYRLELGKNRDVYAVNREFGVQLSYLTEIARRHQIPVIVTNQVYADFDDNDRVKIVGGDILRYASKCLLEIRKLNGGNRIATLRKHRSLEEDRQTSFRIIKSGLGPVEETPLEKKIPDTSDFQPGDAVEK